jgi:hypothetical protein
MEFEISHEISSGKKGFIEKYSSDSDTYIRKNCYLILAGLYKLKNNNKIILSILDKMAKASNEKIRQTAVYTLGEIGKYDFESVKNRLKQFLNDSHHSVKNGLTGAIKQMGEKNPEPVFNWVKNVIDECSQDMKIKILHGLELRGRTHPEDLLPLLKDILKNNIDKKTKKMLIHIIGQISYKKGCLEKVIKEIKTWDNKEFISECKKEILEVHKNYAKFSAMKLNEVNDYLLKNK